VGPGKLGLEALDVYSSPEGLRLDRGHDHDTDAMAVMILYLHARDLYDFDFRPSRGSPSVDRSVTHCGDPMERRRKTSR
jgi:hypothetical protein